MNKTTRNLLIVFVILAVIYFVFLKGKDKFTTSSVEEKLFEADSSKIDKIEMVKPNETIVLEKNGGIWKVTKPVDYPADTIAITPILSNLKNFKIESEISSNPEKFSNYFDSTNNTKVSVYQEGKLLGIFTLGKGGQGYETSYIKKENENKVYLASKLNSYNFNKALKDFRSKLIMSLQSFTISKIDFKSTDSNKVEFTAIKDSTERWFIGSDSIPKSNIDGFLNLLANMSTDDFKDSTITEFPSATYTITIHPSQPGAAPTIINFYKLAPTLTEYVVQISGKQQLFKFSDGFAANYLKKRKDFIPEKK